MNDSTFTIFIIFGCIWIAMATASVISLLKADGQKIRFGKTGLIVIIPIIVPIIFTLAYAAFRGTF
ncbi:MULTISPECIES: hypothetical protein [unclassified Nodularia (in: cyanobacteria)]|uniref:hypothetical protein n=1 Tax=unclassified Nodularia (in: cyanobacteria) TaxID=2656917 RepID=UPI001D117BF3|nr:hypothetical protein [Nodularia sp. LEGE 04288]MCC2692266.1 hypothetical protein [Nodularia sp. LEGE 04288]